ncbi:hypothetical protein [Dyella sp. S184]|uniref:hypothetical protein n=1 Tax=Dyella sp. S184 TaxID=1641862 RepID=UPI00131DEDD8|nr:hypothetical protein [Dyella sp. S184]
MPPISTDWLIKNAELVNEDRRLHADLRVKDGLLKTTASNLDGCLGEQMIDDRVCGQRSTLDH